MARLRRWLYLAHRWLGIALGLLIVLWFASGIVMMYVGYPKLTPAERLAHLPDLELPSECCLAPAEAARLAGHAGRHAPELRLAMVGERPRWIVSGGGHAAAVDAATGEAPPSFGAAGALVAAARFAPDASPRLVETLREDIYTVSRALDPHRPLHLVALDDAAGSELYVSSRTGEVVRDSTRSERAWNWAGAILHWFYPLKGEWMGAWRRDAIIYTSLAGTVLALSGLVVGVLRWRVRGRYRSGSKSPYREGWMRWHHVAGLAFGAVTLTWVLSGLLSMNPWKVFDAGGAKPDAAALAGTTLAGATFALTPREAVARSPFPVRELSVRLFGGRAWYVLHGAGGESRLVDAGDRGAAPFPMLAPEAIEPVAGRLLPGHRPTRIERLDRHDDYYYARRAHTMTGHFERRLPIYRVAYDDPGRTWIHLDPRTGAIVGRLDDRARARRWLFAFLHSFDGWGWTDSRPAWDIALILLSAGGLAVSLSGVVIGWRRLAGRHHAAARRAPAGREQSVTGRATLAS